MLRYLGSRILPSLLVLSVLVLSMVRLVPGDPLAPSRTASR
ncbi:hypothetical protein [Microbacterium sp. 18062]|nr:hypothetical protein [Microbacterium sp. 18062]